MRGQRNSYRVFVGIHEDRLEDLGLYERLILKSIQDKRAWIGFMWLRL